MPPAALRLEVTESTLMADVARAQEVLTRLAELGVGLSVDDFGTGYSSLAHLKRLPVDELKIDMSFVRHIGVSA
jgi:EAL domain-containing protein (putative c-di-GMP-specific phosphodiesterase class I)